MVIAYGPPGVIFANRTIQRPSAPATVLRLCFRNVTVTFSPGAAVPHTGTARPLCSTAWSLNRADGFTSARKTPAEFSSRNAEKAMNLLRCLRIFSLFPDAAEPRG